MPEWIKVFTDYFELSIYVQPGAKKTEIVGVHDKSLKIKIAAPPVDGNANEVLIQFLAKSLGCPIRSVEISSGEKSRHKKIRVSDMGKLDKGKALVGKNKLIKN